MIGLLILASVVGTPSAPAYTLAGVRLRDTPVAARAALVKAGYQIIAVKQSESYRARLARASALRIPPPATLPMSVESIQAQSSDQRVRVSFMDNEAGARVVARVDYVGSDLLHPYPRVRAALVERQGQPTKQRPQSTAWCPQAGDDCDAGGIPQSDMLAVRASNEGMGKNTTEIELRVGDRTERLWSNSFNTELRRSTPARDAY